MGTLNNFTDNEFVKDYLVNLVLKEGSFVEVGAHRGTTSLDFANLGWKVLSFEPEKENFKELFNRTKDIKKIECVNKAVSDYEAKDVLFYTSKEHTGIHSFKPFHSTHRPDLNVDVVMLSNELKKRKITHVDFLEIDVEGAELSVLKGFDFKKFKPEIIMCEFMDDRTQKYFEYNHHDLVSYVSKYGYTAFVSEWEPIKKYGKSDEFPQHKFIQIKSYPLDHNPSWGNLIFVPNKKVKLFNEFLRDYLFKFISSNAPKKHFNQNILDELDSMKNSKCWKITKPLRVVDQLRIKLTKSLSGKVNYSTVDEIEKSKYPLEYKESFERIKRLKNIHKGESCFIIGNGPSLNNMDLGFLKNYHTFGLNKIYLMENRGIDLDLSYHVCVNKLVLEQSANEFEKLKCPSFLGFKGYEDVKSLNHINFILTHPKYASTMGFQEDISRGVSEGHTVTYVAMQIAYYLGFKNVFLIGVDHSFKCEGKPDEKQKFKGDDLNHFDPNYFKGNDWHLPNLDASEKSYKLAKYCFEKDGRKIYDATVGGKLDIFPKISYEKALEVCKKK